MYFAHYDFYEINKHKLRVCFFDTTVLIMNSILIILFGLIRSQYQKMQTI